MTDNKDYENKIHNLIFEIQKRTYDHFIKQITHVETKANNMIGWIGVTYNFVGSVGIILNKHLVYVPLEILILGIPVLIMLISLISNVMCFRVGKKIYYFEPMKLIDTFDNKDYFLALPMINKLLAIQIQNNSSNLSKKISVFTIGWYFF